MNKQERLQELIKTVQYHDSLYAAGAPIISDAEYDNLYFELVALEKELGASSESPTQKVRSDDMQTGLRKVIHNHPMLSLAKTKSIDELKNWINDDNDYIFMAKMDGLTCSLTYKDYELVGAETRGNGYEGTDILENIKTLSNVPKHINIPEAIIDGEIICKLDDFKEFKNEYANPRNFAAGSIQLLDSKECARRKLTFVAWDRINDDNSITKLSEKLLYLNYLGFTICPFLTCINDAEEKVYSIDNLQQIIDTLQNKSKELNYPIDGLVCKINNCQQYNSLGTTSHHPSGALAFKFYDEEYDTILRNIEFTMGRTGVLTPVAIFDPVENEGIITRANLHNLSIMWKILGNYPHRGQPIKIIKANQIIPQVSWADQEHKGNTDNALPIPTVCPFCGKPTHYARGDGDTITLVCNNLDCQGKLINKLEHYGSKKGLNILGLSKATLEKLIDWGWVNSLCDLHKLENYRTQWESKSGFGKKSVDKILSAIAQAQVCELDKFICAIGIPLIGGTASKALADHFETWQAFRGAVKNNFNFSHLEGFGPEMDYALHHFNYDEADELESQYIIIPPTVKEKINTESAIRDKCFVITGKMRSGSRDEIASRILAAGGRVATSVSNKTNYLVNNDINSTSVKNNRAKELNIPIISEDELLKLLT